jgi:tetratricopeptide (TPR) repeat protein
MKKTAWITALFLSIAGMAGAQQSDWKWPEDINTAKEKNALYTDSKQMGNFREAANALSWLLVNAPDLNESIYINGAEIYDELASAEKDAAKKLQLQDSALLMYDLRIKYFGDEANVLDRKAFFAYKYQKDDREKLADLYNLFSRAVELNGENTMFSNAVAYMDVTRRHKLVNKTLTDDQVLDNYDKAMLILNAAEKKYGADKVEKYKGIVDDLLVKTVNVDCQFVEANFGPKMQANPDDLGTAKKLFKLLTVGECTDNPLYMTSLQTIYKHEPTYGLARLIGVKLLSDGQLAKAEEYLNNAISQAESPADKAETYLMIAQASAKQGQKSKARSLAYKAIEADANVASKAYTLIGTLYMGSHEDCFGGESRVTDRSIYLAAYKMFEKAGNAEMMRKAAEQFPSAEEIFNENMEVGQQVTVGCWIGETVTLKKR